jgi:hypothetical protein
MAFNTLNEATFQEIPDAASIIDEVHRTPLMACARTGSFQNAKQLIEHGNMDFSAISKVRRKWRARFYGIFFNNCINANLYSMEKVLYSLHCEKETGSSY